MRGTDVVPYNAGLVILCDCRAVSRSVAVYVSLVRCCQSMPALPVAVVLVYYQSHVYRAQHLLKQQHGLGSLVPISQLHACRRSCGIVQLHVNHLHHSCVRGSRSTHGRPSPAQQSAPVSDTFETTRVSYYLHVCIPQDPSAQDERSVMPR
jgi:hypothetical protein